MGGGSRVSLLIIWRSEWCLSWSILTLFLFSDGVVVSLYSLCLAIQSFS